MDGLVGSADQVLSGELLQRFVRRAQLLLC
jgi:hypothetical protein